MIACFNERERHVDNDGAKAVPKKSTLCVDVWGVGQMPNAENKCIFPGTHTSLRPSFRRSGTQRLPGVAVVAAHHAHPVPAQSSRISCSSPEFGIGRSEVRGFASYETCCSSYWCEEHARCMDVWRGVAGCSRKGELVWCSDVPEALLAWATTTTGVVVEE